LRFWPTNHTIASAPASLLVVIIGSPVVMLFAHHSTDTVGGVPLIFIAMRSPEPFLHPLPVAPS
jgi:hypothetical protein